MVRSIGGVSKLHRVFYLRCDLSSTTVYDFSHRSYCTLFSLVKCICFRLGKVSKKFEYIQLHCWWFLCYMYYTILDPLPSLHVASVHMKWYPGPSPFCMFNNLSLMTARLGALERWLSLCSPAVSCWNASGIFGCHFRLQSYLWLFLVMY